MVELPAKHIDSTPYIHVPLRKGAVDLASRDVWHLFGNEVSNIPGYFDGAHDSRVSTQAAIPEADQGASDMFVYILCSMYVVLCIS